MGGAKRSGTRVTMRILILSLLITVVVSQSTRQEPPPGQRCSGRNYNGRRCCTPEQPCGLGEGDCDGPLDGGTHDGHQGCRGDLVCGSNNCRKFGAYFHEKDDCCEKRLLPLMESNKPIKTIKPSTSKTCKGRNFLPRPCCTPQSPCPEGEGDCEVDNDCSGDLVCGNNNCKQFGSFYHEKDDCCVKPTASVKPQIPQLTTSVPLEPRPGQKCAGRNYQG